MGSLTRIQTRRYSTEKFNYGVLETRKVLAAIFPTYIDGELTLGNPNSAAPYALADTFELETNPGASKTIFLDFDGHRSVNNAWDHDINFPAWNRDGSASFSSAELIEIQRQFQNVAEDFAPFDVNVTTKDPGIAALTKSAFLDPNFGVRVVSTQATDNFGSGFGGIAYVNSFNDNIDNPVFVFNKGPNNGAQTISHEVGHALGLSHDGLNSRTYHTGVGSGETAWGPLLGSPFSRNLTQWSNGDYAGANQTQDDLAIITSARNGINYKADDVGNTIASASLLQTDGDLVFDWGIVERNTDADYFEFTTSGGLVDLQINAFAENPNLDVRIRLYDDSGSFVLSNNHADRVDALVRRNLSAGTYYLAVEGVGKPGVYSDYGSLGFYSIEGSIPGASEASSTKIGEVGNIPNLNHNWKTIQFSQSYENPVVVAGPASRNGGDVVTVRIRNVTSDSFQIHIDEWDYRDGRHGIESVDYFVVEAGTHELSDGTILQAATINSQTQQWSRNSFGGAFSGSSDAPVVISSVTSVNEDSAVITRLNNVTNAGFSLKLQEEQGADYVHAAEEVNWIAIQQGSASTGLSDFIVNETGKAVTQRSHTIDLDFESRPSFFAQMQSNFGGDPVTVRARSLEADQAVIFLEEERSADNEIIHLAENVGYIAIPQGDLFRAETNRVTARVAESTVLETTSEDGDLSAAAEQLESWGELYFDESQLSHAGHDHSQDNSHGGGCGCAACAAAMQSMNQVADRSQVQLSNIEFDQFARNELPLQADTVDGISSDESNDHESYFEHLSQQQLDTLFDVV